jgi:hypothetical protein
MRVHGISLDVFSNRIGPLISVAVTVLSIDLPLARLAGEIRAHHYSREGTALSLADCLLLASAEKEDRIASADGAVIATAQTLGIAVIPLPDSRGRRPVG